jgi:predicted component of type VI protein secretion system
MNASLVLLKKNGAHRAFPLPSSVTVIGRRHDCDLIIPLPTVSRKHCRLTRNEDSVKLLDLGSRCGTFVNDERVDQDREVPVKAGDYIRIGPLTFVCQIDGKPEKIAAPPKAAPQGPKARPQPPKAAAQLAQDDELADLDVSDSFINLDESDSDLEDLKDL